MNLLTVEAIIFVCALSLDTFVSSMALGIDKIKVPVSSAAVINLICSGILCLSLLIGSAIRPYLPEMLASVICCIILVAFGILRLLDSLIKKYINGSPENTREIEFKFLSFKFILHIYADSSKADVDHSKRLSLKEAAPLAVALSIDGFGAGIGAGLTAINFPLLLLLSFAAGMIAVLIGCYIGRRLSGKNNVDISWIGGVILIGLGISKLF